MLTVVLTAVLVGYSVACVEWTLKNSPVIFGKTAELSCLIEANKTHETRVWQGGKDYKVLTTNGATSDPQKYKEKSKIHGSKLESILKIFKLDENDVNYDYSCSIGDREQRQKLALKPADFEMHPTKQTTTVLTVFRNGYLDTMIELTKVYPEPKCRIRFNEVEITKHLSIKRGINGIFYTLTERLQHRFSQDVCSGKMAITCLVGSSDIKIHEEKFDNCIPQGKDEYKDWFIVNVIFGCVLFIFLVIGCIGLGRHRKHCRLLTCSLTFKGEGAVEEPMLPELAQKCIMKENHSKQYYNQHRTLNVN